MTEYEMIIKELRAFIRQTRADADECMEFGSFVTTDRLLNHVVGIKAAMDIVEKVHKQFLEKVGNEK